MPTDLGLLYVLGWMMGVIFASMLAVASRMISDPVFGLSVMVLWAVWWKFVPTL
jgi:hypothetical protein